MLVSLFDSLFYTREILNVPFDTATIIGMKRRIRMGDGIKYEDMMTILNVNGAIYKIDSSMIDECKVGLTYGNGLYIKQIEIKSKKIKPSFTYVNWLHENTVQKRILDILVLKEYREIQKVKEQPLEIDLEYKESIKSLDCIRKIANLSTSKMEYKFDSPKFKAKTFLADLEQVSPKLAEKRLDITEALKQYKEIQNKLQKESN